MEELESTQAARRLLKKKGIEWKPTPTAPPKPITPTPTPKVAEKGVTGDLVAEARKFKSAEEFFFKTGGGKYNLDFIDKLGKAKDEELIGTVGDFIIGSKTREAIGDKVLETKIFAKQNISKEVSVLGAGGVVKIEGKAGKVGERIILIDNKESHIKTDVIATILEEIAHTKRGILGREFKKIDFKKMSIDDIEKLPHEISGKKFGKHLHSIKEDRQQLTNIWKQAQPVAPKAVIEPVKPKVQPTITKAEVKPLDEVVPKEMFTGVGVPTKAITRIKEKAIETAHKLHDWTFTFGEARRTDPGLYEDLLLSYSRRNAGIEKAVSDVKGLLEKTQLSTDEAAELSLIFEDKTLKPSPEQKDIYDKFSKLFKDIEKKELKEGIFTKRFQDRMIDEINEQINAIQSGSQLAGASLPIKTPTGAAKTKHIERLIEEKKVLQNMRYLPHNIVAERAIEAKLNSLGGEERKVFLEKLGNLSAKFRKRTGRKLLKDYLDSGLINKSDIDIRKLAIETVNSYHYRASLNNLYKQARDRGYIKPSSQELLDQGWYSARKLGIIAPELKNQLVHPLLANALAEMKEMQIGKRGNIVTQTLGLIKIAQFIKPGIIWIYNAVQKYFRGMYSLNPIKEVKFALRSMSDVLGESARYHELNALNLYSFPYETPKAAKDEAIKIAVRRTTKEIPGLMKKLERITGMSWAKGDINPQDLLMAPYRVLANATWTGDKIQRTQSVYILENMGYGTKEAVKVASRGHGAYSDLSLKFKKTMSPIVFVHSFRVLMPMEMGKVIGEPIKEVLQAKAGKRKIPRHRMNRMVKAIVGTIAMPVIIDTYMKARGFEKDKFLWKWKKKVQGKEIVVGVNFILNMPLKYWHRLTYYNPIKAKLPVIQGFEQLLKWEIHPAWRLMMDIKDNRRSFGAGQMVYDPDETNWRKQLWQAGKYFFGQGFRFYGKLMDAADAGNLTTKEMAANKKIMDAGLSNLDKILLATFGYAYVRSDLKDRQRIMRKSLEYEKSRRIWNIKTKYSGKVKRKKLQNLKQWETKCKYWIRNTMK